MFNRNYLIPLTLTIALLSITSVVVADEGPPIAGDGDMPPITEDAPMDDGTQGTTEAGNPTDLNNTLSTTVEFGDPTNFIDSTSNSKWEVTGIAVHDVVTNKSGASLDLTYTPTNKLTLSATLTDGKEEYGRNLLEGASTVRLKAQYDLLNNEKGNVYIFGKYEKVNLNGMREPTKNTVGAGFRFRF